MNKFLEIYMEKLETLNIEHRVNNKDKKVLCVVNSKKDG